MMWDNAPRDAGKYPWPAKTNEETSISLDMQKEHSRTNLILDLFHLEWLRYAFESLS